MSALRAPDFYPAALPDVERRRTAGAGAGKATEAELSELVTRARAGDREAFERLVLITSPTCYALALRLVGNQHDARDVVQDAYLRAFRGLRKFRGDASFPTWLHRITVNCAASLTERRARSSHVLLDDRIDSRRLVDGAAESQLEAATSSVDERDRLVAALGELPDRLRVVVVLRDVYDLSHRDIAKELGISQAAAKVRLHRARRMLQEQLFTASAAPDRGAVSRPGSSRGVRR